MTQFFISLKKFLLSFQKKPAYLDFFILSLLTIAVTWQPFYLEHEIINLDYGIHLPCINALFHGLIPYRDFNFYRGPFELYIPALMMQFFGKNTAVLATFFYAGSVLTLIFSILLACQLFRTRFILYLFALVLIGRTFPRIAYYYWGGLRYFIGLMALWLAFESFKRRRLCWMFFAGVVSALSLLTTIEAGVATVGAFGLGFLLTHLLEGFDRGFLARAVQVYIIGFFIILASYGAYLLATHSMIPFLESTYVIATRIMSSLLDARGTAPEGFWQVILAMFPSNKYFEYMTPIYCFIFLLAYFCLSIKRRTLSGKTFYLASLAGYAVILFVSSFRKIEGHHFDMALQPEKVLYFFLLEETYFFLMGKRADIYQRLQNARAQISSRLLQIGQIGVIQFIFLALFMSSVCYSLQRFNSRFISFKIFSCRLQNKSIDTLKPLYGEDVKTLEIERARGMVVPRWQAEDIEGAVAFIKENTAPNDIVFTYPELGNFNFWFDRPFLGRFPIACVSWVDENWHKELVADFLSVKPKFILSTYLRHRTFPAILYFRYPANLKKYHEISAIIDRDYRVVKSFFSFAIYQRKIDAH